jgi:WD40 repeat protein/predicted Ser/Thr protein kinase
MKSGFCSTCGNPLDPSLGNGLCPVCLIDDALATGESQGVGDVLGTIGGLELLEVIARGGMGVVYRARQRVPRREVALKALPGTDLHDFEARERFRIEVETMASLEHPSILPVYESGEEDGTPFFTMKLAGGGSLAMRMRRYEAQWKEIAGLMIRVARAVDFAHQRGILHRDIKPGNILFDDADKVYVSDFGLAKLVGQQSDLTRSIAMLGTPHYLAPEIARKNVTAASVASDVWSLGAVLFELLAGRAPFTADAVPSLLRSIVEDEPSPPPQDVPRPLRIIALKALSKEPAHRYASAADFADDLGRWLRGDAILARPTNAFARVWMQSRKRPAVVMAAVIALISVGGLAWVEVGRRSEARRSESAMRAMQEEGRSSLLALARAGRAEKIAGWRESGLETLRKAAAIRPDADLRDEAIAHFAGFDLKETSLPGRLPDGDPELEYSSTKRAVPDWDAATDREAVVLNGRIVVRQRSDQKVIAEFSDPRLDEIYVMVLGPGGRMVVVMTKTFQVLLLDTQSARAVASWEDAGILEGNVGKDVMFVLTGLPGKPQNGRKPDTTFGLAAPKHTAPLTMFAISLRDGRRFPPIPHSEKEGISALVVASDSLDQPFVAITGEDFLRIWNWRTGEQVLSRRITSAIEVLEWNGGRFVSCDTAGAVAVYDPLRKSQSDIPIVNHRVEGFVTTSDGRALLLRNEVNVVTVIQPDSLAPLVEMSRKKHEDALAIRLRRKPPEVVLNEADGKSFRQLLRPEIVRSLSFTSLGMTDSPRAHYSPDGRWLMLVSKQELRILDHAGGMVLLTMPLDDAFGAFFSHDSRHIILCEKQKISLHELFLEDSRLKARHVRELKSVDEPFSSYPTLSYNRRWLSIPETPERVLVLDCGDFTTWQSFPAHGVANVTWPSGDGRWLVAGSRKDAGLRLWDRKAGGEAGILREGNSSPKFSPDDRWLAEKDFDNGQLTIFDTRTWEPVFRTPPLREEWAVSIDWSPDGRMLAISMIDGRIRLLEAGSWRTLAHLEGCAGDNPGQILFSPCGRNLLGASKHLMHIWDLPELSRQLTAMGLSLALPLPPTSPAPPSGFPEKILPADVPDWFAGDSGK